MGVGLRPQALAQRFMDWATCLLNPRHPNNEEDNGHTEQFLYGLPKKIQVWVSWHQPGSVAPDMKLWRNLRRQISPGEDRPDGMGVWEEDQIISSWKGDRKEESRGALAGACPFHVTSVGGWDS